MKTQLDGTGRQKCTLCKHQSIAGIKSGHGKCPFHWASGNWGIDYASKIYPNHEQAKVKP